MTISGTAIISGAALVNALELVGKKIDEVKVVVNAAGASGVACAEHYICMGVARETSPWSTPKASSIRDARKG